MINLSTFRGGLRATVAVLALHLAACGGEATDEPLEPQVNTETREQASGPTSGSGTESPGAATSPPAAGATAEPFSLTVADISVYERGLRREIELLRSAQAQLRQADNDDERLDILGTIQPSELRREAATATGVSEERYRRVTSAVNDVLGKLEMASASRQMMPSAEELANLPAEARARVEENLRQAEAAWGDPYSGLASETAAALEQQTDALAQLRAEHIGLLTRIR